MSLLSPGPRRGGNACLACQGTGKCAACNGTGINLHLNESEPKCQRCAGSGTCSDCQGTGRAFPAVSEIQDLELDKL